MASDTWHLRFLAHLRFSPGIPCSRGEEAGAHSPAIRPCFAVANRGCDPGFWSLVLSFPTAPPDLRHPAARLSAQLDTDFAFLSGESLH